MQPSVSQLKANLKLKRFLRYLNVSAAAGEPTDEMLQKCGVHPKSVVVMQGVKFVRFEALHHKILAQEELDVGTLFSGR